MRFDMELRAIDRILDALIAVNGPVVQFIRHRLVFKSFKIRASSWVIAVLLVGATALVLEGWVVTNLWRWFVAEPFSVPAISLCQSIGIMTLVTILTVSPSFYKEENELDWKKSFWFLYGRPIFFLAAGYLFHLLM